MGLSIVKKKDPLYQGEIHNAGDHFRVHGVIGFDDSYPEDGEPVTAAMFGSFSTLFDLLVFPNGAETPVWDETGGKLLLYTADGTEAADASDQSAVFVRFVAYVR